MTGRPRSEPEGSWLVRRYPRWWRERYADEVLALLEDRPAGWRDRLDLARGALDAHVRGDGGRSPVLVASALIAGAAWTILGAATLVMPAPPDWPGYAVETLPLAVVGAGAMTVAQLGLARRAWPATTVTLELMTGVVVVAGLAWSIALIVAALGGPFGPITAALQTVAAVAAMSLGLAVLRLGTTREGVVLLVTAVALLVPTPLVWLALGATWTGVGVAAAIRSSVDPSTPVGHPG